MFEVVSKCRKSKHMNFGLPFGNLLMIYLLGDHLIGNLIQRNHFGHFDLRYFLREYILVVFLTKHTQ